MCADGTQTALVRSISPPPFTAGAFLFKWMLVGQMTDTERLPSKVLRPLQAHLAFYGTGRRAQTLRTLRPSLACVTLRAEFDGKPLHVLASLMHLRSFPLDDLVIRDGIGGFHDLLFNAIIRWRLLWVDLGCEPTDGEAVLSCFVAPQPPTCARSQCFPVLNVVADQSVKWTLSFSSFLVSVNVILAVSSQPSGKPPSIPTFLQSCTCVRLRCIRLVAGHFFHHVLGMCCITHMHKHGHLRFIVLLMEAPFCLFIYFFLELEYIHLDSFDIIFLYFIISLQKQALLQCVCVLWKHLWIYSWFLLWRLMVDYCDTCQHIYRYR